MQVPILNFEKPYFGCRGSASEKYTTIQGQTVSFKSLERNGVSCTGDYPTYFMNLSCSGGKPPPVAEGRRGGAPFFCGCWAELAWGVIEPGTQRCAKQWTARLSACLIGRVGIAPVHWLGQTSSLSAVVAGWLSLMSNCDQIANRVWLVLMPWMGFFCNC